MVFGRVTSSTNSYYKYFKIKFLNSKLVHALLGNSFLKREDTESNVFNCKDDRL